MAKHKKRKKEKLYEDMDDFSGVTANSWKAPYIKKYLERGVLPISLIFSKNQADEEGIPFEDYLAERFDFTYDYGENSESQSTGLAESIEDDNYSPFVDDIYFCEDAADYGEDYIDGDNDYSPFVDDIYFCEDAADYGEDYIDGDNDYSPFVDDIYFCEDAADYSEDYIDGDDNYSPFVDDIMEDNVYPYYSFIETEETDYKKKPKLSDLIEALLTLEIFVVTNQGELLHHYQVDTGAYRLLKQAGFEILVCQCFDENLTNKLSTRDYTELYHMILRQPKLQVSITEFNSDETLINVANGIVSICDDKLELLPHTPDILFTYSINVNIDVDGEQETPTFDRFCQTTFRDDPESKRKLFLEMMGYTLSDSMAGKCILFGIGEPNSGKSILMKFLTFLIGDELVSNIALHDLHDKFNKALLFGKKLNIVAEIPNQPIKGIADLKAISSGDKINAQFKGQDGFDFYVKTKIFALGNVLPKPHEIDPTSAFLNRIVILKFAISIDKAEQDFDLLSKLIVEKDEIVKKSLYAFMELRKRSYQFSQPKDTVSFFEDYKMDLNPTEVFAKESLIVIEGETDIKVFTEDLYEAFVDFCTCNKITISERSEMVKQLENIYGLKQKKVRIKGETKAGFVGLKIINNGTANNLTVISNNTNLKAIESNN